MHRPDVSLRPLARIAGPAAFVAVLWLAPAETAAGGRAVLALAAWMVVWWLTEAVPLAATSLLPIAILPLTGAASAREAAAPYASELVFLFLAGFLLAAALERWGGHTRLALALVAALGLGARRLVLGVMLATALISMWISNTATAAMMYPIALATGGLLGDGADARRMRTALMLGVAYAASIGGMATLLGTPPNLIFAGSAEELIGVRVSFAGFMTIGLPIAAILLPMTWALLVFGLFRAKVSIGAESARLLAERRAALGRFGGGERLVLSVFAVTALAWLFREPKELGAVTIPGIASLAPAVTDATIGMLGAIALFVLAGRTPKGDRRPLLTWEEARGIPWDVLLLFGGGLSLAAAMESTGLTRWIGDHLAGLGALPGPAVALGFALLVVALSELASNTAVAAMMMPIAVSLATATGQPPLALLLVATFAASCGFALPIATPPNAIVYGSGEVSVRDMVRAGVILDLVAIAVIVVAVELLSPLLA